MTRTRKYANYYDYSKQKKEETKQRRHNRALGVIVIATFGVGMWVFGSISGQKFGYRRGFRDGKIFANDNLEGFTNHMIAKFEESKGE